MRIVVDPALRIGNAHELQHLDGARPGGRARLALVDAHRLGDLLADGIDGVVVVIVLAFKGRGFEPRRLLTSPMLLMRGLVGAAGILLFYVTISHLGAGRAVILNLTYPIFGAVMAAAWLKESLGLRQLGWMLVGLAGLGLFFAGSAFEGGLTRYEGLALIGAVVAGAAVVLIRVLSRSEHASTIYASQCLWSFAAGLPLGASPIVDLPVVAVAGLVVASVLVSGGQLALTQSFRALSVAKGSSIQMLMPLATSTGGMLFFGERYATMEWVGALITIAATWQVVRNPVARSA